MRALPRDHRGYPVPHIVYRDEIGKAWFTINDDDKVMHCLKFDLCSICGQKLLRGRWLVGGPLSAFLPEGAYFDIPMHHECAAYALRVCPWLASPNYNKTIATKRLPMDTNRAFLDQTTMPGKPDVFVAIMVTAVAIGIDGGSLLLKPQFPPLRTEFWKDGLLLSDVTGRAIADAAVAKYRAGQSERRDD